MKVHELIQWLADVDPEMEVALPHFLQGEVVPDFAEPNIEYVIPAENHGVRVFKFAEEKGQGTHPVVMFNAACTYERSANAYWDERRARRIAEANARTIADVLGEEP